MLERLKHKFLPSELAKIFKFNSLLKNKEDTRPSPKQNEDSCFLSGFHDDHNTMTYHPREHRGFHKGG